MFTTRGCLNLIGGLIGALFLIGAAWVPAACAQSSPADASDPQGISGFFLHWDERALQAQRDQPNWLTPVVTSTARLKQEVRYDVLWQWNGPDTSVGNFGNSKGFTTIPLDRVEISVNPPPYIVHNGSNLRDGFGDFSFMVKFRLLAANREHGDYVLTAFVTTSFPTASYRNGSPHPVITPTIAGGKGLGDFVYQGTFGSDLPSAQAALLGRRLIWNNALQYRRWGRFWPEMEINSNFYAGGPSDGKKQVYATPGISAGRFVIYRNLQLTVGAGMEFALTRFHSYEHQAVFTMRLPF